MARPRIHPARLFDPMGVPLLSTLRSAYAWFLLAMILLPVLVLGPILHFLTTPIDRHRSGFRWAVASWVSLYGRLSPLYHFDVSGIGNLPQKGAYVLVANHDSGLDIIGLFMLRTRARIMADAKFFALPIAGWLLRACEHIPVNPSDADSRKEALAVAEQALRDGCSVMVFPEGKILPDTMGGFRPGAFVAAARAEVPVVPLLLDGTSAWRSGTAVVEGRHLICVRAFPAIPRQDVLATKPEDLARDVRALIAGAHSHKQAGEMTGAREPNWAGEAHPS